MSFSPVDIEIRANGMSEVSRSDLAAEFDTTDQKLSRLINGIIAAHIETSLLECNGRFTSNGLHFMREFLSITGDGRALGNARKAFVLASKSNSNYEKLYRDWEEPEVEWEIDLDELEPKSGGLLAIAEKIDSETDSIIDNFETPLIARQIMHNPLASMISEVIGGMQYRQVYEETRRQLAANTQLAIADAHAHFQEDLTYQLHQK